MKVGLIDVDSRHYPNLALMKLSAWHKTKGDDVEWWWGLGQYDRVYMSKVFDSTYTPDMPLPLNAKEIVQGGTGYGLENRLPEAVERIYPDYSLYPELTKDTAYGFLSRGCPRACPYCIVSEKEGRWSVRVADLSEWWHGQRNIVLMDPNLLACPDRIELLDQLVESRARVDINQGLDCRLLNEEIIGRLNQLRLKEIHFAWDSMHDADLVLQGLILYAKSARQKPHGRYGTVYCLVNFDTSIEEDLHRIYTLRDIGYAPYVMVYNKPYAPREIRLLQRWCNNRRFFRAVPHFYDFNPRRV